MPEQSDKELLLWVSLVLNAKHEARDMAKVIAAWRYAKRAGVTTLVIKYASMYELPDALSHPTVLMALEIAKSLGLRVILGRNGWVKRSGIGDVSTMENVAHYAAAISTVIAEARSVGAMSFLDGEPYGDSKIKANYKKRDIPLDELWRIKLAIRAATDVAGAVDYSYPADSHSSDRYPWCMRHLGNYWMNSTTYPWTIMPEPVPIAPGGFTLWQDDHWGTWVTHDQKQSKYVNMTNKPLTPEQALAIKAPRQWLYIGGNLDEFGPTLKALAEARENK